jgi:hypothetical protein
MATLDSLTGRIPMDLEALLMDPAQVRAMEDQLFSRAEGDIQRQAGNEAQRVSENAFGRGMGLSSVNAFAQAQNERARAEALSKARVDSNQAATAAQRAALGQAASYVTAQQQRQQQADQFRKSMKHQGSMNTQNLVASGLAGLTGAGLKMAGNVWGDDMRKGLKGFMNGGGGDSPSASPSSSGPLPYAANDYQDPLAANPNAITAPEISGGSLGELASAPEYAFDFDGGGGGGGMELDPGDFDLGGDWGGGTDLWALLNDDWSF